MRLLFIYRYFTHGGVEAVLYNRYHGIKHIASDIEVGAVFLYRYNRANVTLADKIYFTSDMKQIGEIIKKYDVISIIDTPEVFETVELLRKSIIVEVHSHYSEHRKYIRNGFPFTTKIVLTPSRYFMELVKKEMKSKSKEIDFVYNPVGYPFFDDVRCEQGVKIGSFKPVLWVGRFDKLKNWELSLDIFAEVLRRLNRKDMELFLIGRSFDIDGDLEKFRKHGNLAYIRYLPYVDFNAMPYIYRKVREKGGVYLSTSSGESFGMTIAEAMACGLPCVLNDLEPFREITDGNAGFYHSIEEAVDLLLNLMGNKKLYNKISERGREISKRFYPDNVARIFLDKVHMAAGG